MSQVLIRERCVTTSVLGVVGKLLIVVWRASHLASHHRKTHVLVVNTDAGIHHQFNTRAHKFATHKYWRTRVHEHIRTSTWSLKQENTIQHANTLIHERIKYTSTKIHEHIFSGAHVYTNTRRHDYTSARVHGPTMMGECTVYSTVHT